MEHSLENPSINVLTVSLQKTAVFNRKYCWLVDLFIIPDLMEQKHECRLHLLKIVVISDGALEKRTLQVLFIHPNEQ